MSNNADLSIKVSGLKDLQDSFKKAPKALKAALKRGARLSMTILKRQTKSRAPNAARRVTATHNGQTVHLLSWGATGALKKAITSKVGVSRKTGGVFGLVGIDKNAGVIAFNPLGRNAGRQRVRPVNYAHLVEFGFMQKYRWARRLLRPLRVKAKPFMRPALYASQAAIGSRMRQTLREELAKATINQVGNQP